MRIPTAPKLFPRAVLLKVWSPEEQQQHHLGTCYMCRFLDPIPDCLNWRPWGWSLCMLSRFGCVQFFATPWTVAHQAPLSMGFSMQDYWSRLPCPPPIPDSGIEPTSLMSPALAGQLFTNSV